MPSGLSDNSSLVSIEGQSIILDFKKTGATTGVLTWTIPTTIRVYGGMLLTASLKEINPSNYPTDKVRYTASADLSTPADTIGLAQVVGALYNDVLTTTLNLTGLTPDTEYYFAAHMTTNVLSYFSVGVRSYPQDQSSKTYAGDIAIGYGPPATAVIGQVYYDEDQNMVFFYDGSVWLPTTPGSTLSGLYDPATPFTGLPVGYPAIGDFFYNTRLKILKCWNGTLWENAESKTGIPMYEKPDVGTDNTYSARSNLIMVLKHQLGYPSVCVELNENHFNIAIDNALMEIRRRTDSAYSKQYFFATLQPGQNTYYLNDPAVGTNSIVDVIRINRLSGLGLGNFAPDNIYAQQFLTQFYAPGVGYDLVSIHLLSSMAETFSKVFAGEIAFNWRESSRELTTYRTVMRPEKVLLETSCEKFEQELLQGRWTQQWLQSWAEAELMMMLGHIRGKFASLPGPGGSLSLNADTMLAEGQRIQENCLREIRDMEVGQNGPDNFYMPFAIG